MLAPAVLGGAIVLGLVARASSAHACSPPDREDHILLPAGAVIPADVRGIPVLLSGGPDGRRVTLRTAGGEVVPAEVTSPTAGSPEARADESLLVPAAPLAPGDYRVVLAATTTAPEVSTPFTVVGNTTPPAPAMTVTVARPIRGEVTIPGGAACSFEADSAVIDVTVAVPEAYRAYRDLVVFDARRNDPSDFYWALGVGESVFPEPDKGIPATLTKTYRVARGCKQGAGRASISFSARVRGLEGVAQETAEVVFPLCDGLEPAPVAPGEGGDATAASSEAGCSAAPRRSVGQGALASSGVLAAIAAVLVRRRRRSPRTGRRDARALGLW